MNWRYQYVAVEMNWRYHYKSCDYDNRVLWPVFSDDTLVLYSSSTMPEESSGLPGREIDRGEEGRRGMMGDELMERGGRSR